MHLVLTFPQCKIMQCPRQPGSRVTRLWRLQLPLRQLSRRATTALPMKAELVVLVIRPMQKKRERQLCLEEGRRLPRQQLGNLSFSQDQISQTQLSWIAQLEPSISSLRLFVLLDLLWQLLSAPQILLNSNNSRCSRCYISIISLQQLQQQGQHEIKLRWRRVMAVFTPILLCQPSYPILCLLSHKT